MSSEIKFEDGTKAKRISELELGNYAEEKKLAYLPASIGAIATKKYNLGDIEEATVASAVEQATERAHGLVLEEALEREEAVSKLKSGISELQEQIETKASQAGLESERDARIAENSTLQTQITSSKSEIEKIDRAIGMDVLTELSLSADPDQVQASLTKTNIKTGFPAYSTETVKAVTLSYSGVMDVALLRSLLDMQRDIQQLKETVTNSASTAPVEGLGDNPAQQDITDAFAEATGTSPEPGDKIVDIDNNIVWIWNGTVWQILQNTDMNLASPGNPGFAKHSAVPGTIAYFSPGIGQLIGYDDLLNRLADAESNLKNKITEAPKDGRIYARVNGTWVPISLDNINGEGENSMVSLSESNKIHVYYSVTPATGAQNTYAVGHASYARQLCNTEGLAAADWKVVLDDAATSADKIIAIEFGSRFNESHIPDSFLRHLNTLVQTELNFPASVTSVGDYFMASVGPSARLRRISIPSLERCGACFMYNEMYYTSGNNTIFENYLTTLTSLSLPNLTTAGNSFMHNIATAGYMNALTSLSLPNLTTAGNSFMHNASVASTTQSNDVQNHFFNNLALLSLPKLTTLLHNAFRNSSQTSSLYGSADSNYMNALTSLSLPELTTAGNYFFCDSNISTVVNSTIGASNAYMKALTSLSLPKLTRAGTGFFMNSCSCYAASNTPGTVYYMSALTSLSLPALTAVEHDFWASKGASGIHTYTGPLDLPELVTAGNNFMAVIPASSGSVYRKVYNLFNNTLTMPKLTTVGDKFLAVNADISAIGTELIRIEFNKPLSLPSLESVGNDFMSSTGSNINNRKIAFNSPLTLGTEDVPCAFGINFMLNANLMTGVITWNASGTPTDNNSLATESSSAAMYATGVPVRGANAQAVKAALPNRSAAPFRKLLA